MSRQKDLKQLCEDILKEGDNGPEDWMMVFLGHIAESIAVIADTLTKERPISKDLADHLKHMAWETAMNNSGLLRRVDTVYADLAENRIDLWLAAYEEKGSDEEADREVATILNTDGEITGIVPDCSWGRGES